MSEQPEADTLQLYSFSACPSGYSYDYSQTNAMQDRQCVPCEVGFYSLGFNSECRECSFYDRTNAQFYYETNHIDNSCFEDNILIQASRISGLSIAAIAVGCVALVTLLIFVACCACKNDKCCPCFIANCACLIPARYRANMRKYEDNGREPDDFDDIGERSTTEKKHAVIEMQKGDRMD